MDRLRWVKEYGKTLWARSARNEFKRVFKNGKSSFQSGYLAKYIAVTITKAIPKNARRAYPTSRIAPPRRGDFGCPVRMCVILAPCQSSAVSSEAGARLVEASIVVGEL